MSAASANGRFATTRNGSRGHGTSPTGARATVARETARRRRAAEPPVGLDRDHARARLRERRA